MGRILFDVAAPVENRYVGSRPGLTEVKLGGIYVYSWIFGTALMIGAAVLATIRPDWGVPILAGVFVLMPTMSTFGKRITVDNDFSIVKVEKRFLKWMKERRFPRCQIKEIEVSASVFEVPRIIFRLRDNDGSIGVLVPGTPAQIRRRAEFLSEKIGVPLSVTHFAGRTLWGALRRLAGKLGQAALFITLVAVVFDQRVSAAIAVTLVAGSLLNKIIFGPANPRSKCLALDD